MSVPRPATDPVQVVQLLVGTLGGCVSLGLCFYWFWGIAWIIPAVFSAVLLPWPLTRRIGIGFAAAALGAFVGIMTLMVITPAAYEETAPTPSTPAPNPAASPRPSTETHVPGYERLSAQQGLRVAPAPPRVARSRAQVVPRETGRRDQAVRAAAATRPNVMFSSILSMKWKSTASAQ